MGIQIVVLEHTLTHNIRLESKTILKPYWRIDCWDFNVLHSPSIEWNFLCANDDTLLAYATILSCISSLFGIMASTPFDD
jgi:hypothetical protein